MYRPVPADKHSYRRTILEKLRTVVGRTRVRNLVAFDDVITRVVRRVGGTRGPTLFIIPYLWEGGGGEGENPTDTVSRGRRPTRRPVGKLRSQVLRGPGQDEWPRLGRSSCGEIPERCARSIAYNKTTTRSEYDSYCTNIHDIQSIVKIYIICLPFCLNRLLERSRINGLSSDFSDSCQTRNYNNTF